MTSLEERAKTFAWRKHIGQKDDSGRNYFDEHIAQVVHILYMVTNDEEIIAAAWLHDTLEDTETTYEELETEFGKRIADLVHELTHEGTRDKGYYFPRLKSREAIIVKIADRLSNISRMQPWSEERQAQYLRMTRFWRSEPPR